MKISVVIPTCHRPASLARCLEKLLGAEEVIVTDDSRDDATKELVEKNVPRAIWTRGPQRGPAANRNHGARAAAGEWIAFVDDDCVPDEKWLDAIRCAAEDADIVEGKTLCPGQRDTPFEEHVENLTGGVLWSCNFAIRRALFEQMGGFDEDFLEAGGEDMEFAWRVARAGHRVVFAPTAVVVHPPRRLTWPMLWRRATWQQRWGVLYGVKTGARTPFFLAACLDLLRTTLHLVTRFERGHWRASVFRQVLKWLTFPLVLPYLAVWDFRFRRRARRLDPA